MTELSSQKTYLYDWHVHAGAKMVDFAGYILPVSYPLGLKGEHEACRTTAALFDVSHMGQIGLSGPDIISFLNRLLPLNSEALSIGAQAYSFLLNEQGGILDDLMCTRVEKSRFELVVNAACKVADLKHIRAIAAPFQVEIRVRDRSLIALQGPRASEALSRTDLAKACDLSFLQVCEPGQDTLVSRSGYTGEDGFEIALPHNQVVDLCMQLSALSWVQPAGLGARNTLRLEAGLRLYGQDLSADITPLDASLGWAIPKNRTGYVGAETLMDQRATAPAKACIGLLPDGRAPLRTGIQLFNEDSQAIGRITSGSISPTLDRPIALALVDRAAAKGSGFMGELRGKLIKCHKTKLPFIRKSYAK